MSKVERYICDQCGADLVETLPLTFTLIRRKYRAPRLLVHYMSPALQTFHFCCHACLSNWISKQDEEGGT